MIYWSELKSTFQKLSNPQTKNKNLANLNLTRFSVHRLWKTCNWRSIVRDGCTNHPQKAIDSTANFFRLMKRKQFILLEAQDQSNTSALQFFFLFLQSRINSARRYCDYLFYFCHNGSVQSFAQFPKLVPHWLWRYCVSIDMELKGEPRSGLLWRMKMMPGCLVILFVLRT